MMLIRWIRCAVPILAALAVTLSGCTTYVTSQVTAFSDWNGGDAERTYAFTRSPDQRNSIEQATYERMVEAGLSGYAFHRVDESHARYLVGLAYGTRIDQVSVAQPVFYGGWAGPYWGAFNPWWGPVGPWGPPLPPAYVSQTYPVYSHVLGIRISERDSGKEVYNVKARTSGDEPSLVRVMPYLVQSALVGFPLSNGAVRTVTLPVERNSGGATNKQTAVVPAPASVPAAPAQ